MIFLILFIFAFLPLKAAGLNSIRNHPKIESYKLILEKFLKENDCDAMGHHNRSLMSHLLGIYDMLAKENLPADICSAGALHSVYGTSLYKHVSIEPTDNSRTNIADLFGNSAERLAYIFHVSNRPEGLETGILHNRFTRDLINLTTRDLWALRLIEAADVIDEGGNLIPSFPIIYAEWEKISCKSRMSQAIAAKQNNSPDSIQDTHNNFSIPQFLHLGVHFIDDNNHRNEVRSLKVPLTLGKTLIDGPSDRSHIPKRDILPNMNLFMTQLLFPEEINISSYSQFTFTLKDEHKFGMPYIPLWLLNKFLNTNCVRDGIRSTARLDIDVKRLPNKDVGSHCDGVYQSCSEIAEINQNIFLPKNSIDSYKPIARNIKLLGVNGGQIDLSVMKAFKSDIQVCGYAVVTVDYSDQKIIDAAYASFIELDNIIRTYVSNNFNIVRHFDGKRYYGWIGDNGTTKWLQLRMGLERKETLNEFVLDISNQILKNNIDDLFPNKTRVDGVNGYLVQEKRRINLVSRVKSYVIAMLNSTQLLDRYARDLFRLFYPDQMDIISPRYRHYSGFGPGVHRMYRYTIHSVPSDKKAEYAAGLHTDMGLLTLSPRSTHPALCILKPNSFEIMEPENDLHKNDWIVFSGETLAYLSGNRYSAAMHFFKDSLAPFSESRYSMPFYQRANPDKILFPENNNSEIEKRKRIIKFARKAINIIDGDIKNPVSIESSILFVPALSTRKLMNEHIGILRPWRSSEILSDF